MVFEALMTSAEKGELLLVDGGLCRFHLRKDDIITIYEILVLPERRREGIGRAMLRQLVRCRPRAIMARVPADLKANRWYASMGFHQVGVETARSGRPLNVWRMECEWDGG